MLIFASRENNGPKWKAGACDVSEAVEEEKARRQSGGFGRTKLDGHDGNPGLERTWRG